jgi:hypothetical protein
MVLMYSMIEGVMQADPLSMFVYGIGILPSICYLKQEFPAVKLPRHRVQLH